MTVRKQILLSTLTTLRVGGAARYVIDVCTKEDLQEALAFVREQALPYTVLGSGSNVLASDAGYDGVILRMRIPGLSFTEDDDGGVVEAGAGGDGVHRRP